VDSGVCACFEIQGWVRLELHARAVPAARTSFRHDAERKRTFLQYMGNNTNKHVSKNVFDVFIKAVLPTVAHAHNRGWRRVSTAPSVMLTGLGDTLAPRYGPCATGPP
jgi:hypothetical protein